MTRSTSSRVNTFVQHADPDPVRQPVPSHHLLPWPRHEGDLTPVESLTKPAGPGWIEYPFNEACGTAQEYQSYVKAWIYDAEGADSQPTVVQLVCTY